MIYRCDLIDPSLRYEHVVGQPRYCIIVHNSYYLQLVESSVCTESTAHIKGTDILLVNAREGVTSTHKAMIRNYFKGSRIFINIGSAGGIGSATRLGSLVLSKGVVCDSGFSSIVMKEKKLLKSTSKLTDVFSPVVNTQGFTWCVPSLYYSRALLKKRLEKYRLVAVEMEQEAINSTGMWLNYNYGKSYGKCSYTGVFYISDLLPLNGEKWTDTLRDDVELRKHKKNLLDIIVSQIRKQGE